MRNVVYSSLVEGSRGMLFYDWYGSSCDLPDTTTHRMIEAIYKEFFGVGLPPGMPPISTILRDWRVDDHGLWSCSEGLINACPADTHLIPSPDDLNYFAAHDPQDNTHWILLAVRDCADGANGVTFTFPVGLRSVDLLPAAYPEYVQPENIQIAGGTFSDDFAGWDVRLYEIVTDPLVDVPLSAGLTHSEFRILRKSPVGHEATIALTLERPGVVEIGVYSASGRLVRRVFDGWLQKGRHTREWNGSNGLGRPVAAGVYFCRVRGPGLDGSEKIVIVD